MRIGPDFLTMWDGQYDEGRPRETDRERRSKAYGKEAGEIADSLKDLPDRGMADGNAALIAKAALRANPLRDGAISERKADRDTPKGPCKRKARA